MGQVVFVVIDDDGLQISSRLYRQCGMGGRFLGGVRIQHIMYSSISTYFIVCGESWS